MIKIKAGKHYGIIGPILNKEDAKKFVDHLAYSYPKCVFTFISGNSSLTIFQFIEYEE